MCLVNCANIQATEYIYNYILYQSYKTISHCRQKRYKISIGAQKGLQQKLVDIGCLFKCNKIKVSVMFFMLVFLFYVQYVEREETICRMSQTEQA
jgi:hypothetical protein